MRIIKRMLLFVLLCLLLTGCKTQCDHVYRSEITQMPTCDGEGVNTFTCALCEDSYTQPIPAQGHLYIMEVIEKEPTCAEEGVKRYTCFTCGGGKTESVQMLEHTLGEPVVSKEPNCSEEGTYSAACTVCGASEVVETIPTNGVHVFTDQVVKEATCTQPGEGVRVCDLCQHRETYSIEITPHNYGQGQIVKKATCTEKGLKSYTCSGCGKGKEEIVSAAGHKWQGATCLAEGVCSVCGVVGSKGDHNYKVTREFKGTDTFAGERDMECETCGNKKKEYFTKDHLVDLDAVLAEVEAYARSLGFQHISINTVQQADRRSTLAVWDMNWALKGPDDLVEGANRCVKILYDAYAPSPAGIGVYTLHLRSYYTQSGSLGGGYFGVSMQITS